MADPRYSYQFTADAPPLAFPVSQGYVPVDYVPPSLPTLELNQLLNGRPTGISPFGPRSGAPSYEMTMPEDDYDYEVTDPRYAVAFGLGPAAFSRRTNGDGLPYSPAPRTVVDAEVVRALPQGASRAALPPGTDPLALPPRPTFSTPRERVMYDLENAALRERFSPNRVQYPPNTWIGIENVYEPFDSARRKIINRGDEFRAGTYTPGKYELTAEERGIWNRNADAQMEKNARRAKQPSSERGLGSQGKAAIERLGRLASKAGSTAMSAAGFTGILSQLIKPDPFDPVGNYIIRSNPEAYPEQVSQYNNAVSNMWY